MSVRIRLLQSLYTSIKDELGFPASLRKVLTNLPAVPIPEDRIASVACHDIVRWHAWGHAEYGQVSGWKQTAHGHEGTGLPLLVNFGLTRKIQHWTCDIQDVHGLGASKSKLSKFSSLDELVETNSRSMIQAVNQQGLKKNLAHKEIRILHDVQSGDYFVRHAWDGRVFLLNSGGSHHFSAARYIAKRIGEQVPLSGRLHEHLLNAPIVLDLIEKFDIYAIPQNWPSYPSPSFHELMRASRVTYFWSTLPQPWNEFRAIFLPKAEIRSARVSHELRSSFAFDLGRHLYSLLQRQESALARAVEANAQSPGVSHCN